MKTVNRTYAVLASMGVAAILLELSFFHGFLNLPQAIYVIAPGFIFALYMTVSTISLGHADFSRPGWRMRYIVGGVLLAAGMPIALAAGAASLTVTERIGSANHFHLGGIGLLFFVAEIVSCVVWSVAMFTWTFIVNRPRALQVLRVALPITIAIMLFANLVEVISKTLWQRSFLLPVISITELIGSALILSIGSSRYTDVKEAKEES